MPPRALARSVLPPAGAAIDFDWRLDSAAPRVAPSPAHTLALQWHAGDRLRVRAAGGGFARLKGTAFAPATGGSCS
ncbi:MAG: hypothetical protein U1E89_20435 [Burkholderiaceae bacterium]